MYFRVQCNIQEIEAPDLETAEQIVRDKLGEVLWLLPITDTPLAPPARAKSGRPVVKEKKGGHGSMTMRH